MNAYITKYRDSCLHILDLDKSIRFACIADMDGNILAIEYNHKIIPFLNLQDVSITITQSIIQLNMRKIFQDKIGRPLYFCTTHENIKIATVIANNVKKANDLLILLSLEKDSDYETIILHKIIPFLENKKP